MGKARYNVPVSAMTVHLIEDRRSVISPWGRGNSKIGPGIYTYSRLPGKVGGTCPGATGECLSICYAFRGRLNKPVWDLWTQNTDRGAELPPLPDDAKVVRFHISGDFDTVEYVRAWIELATSNPEVRFFGYTRSWRVPELLEALEELKRLPNVFLWASMDKTAEDLPPDGWRRAWIDDDARLERTSEKGYSVADPQLGGKKAIICPEESGDLPNCESCGFCFKQHAGPDLVFLKH